MAHHKKKLHTILEVWLQICLGVVTIGLFAVIIVLVQASFAAQTRSDSNQALASIDKINMSLTLGILRLSQGILSALTTFLLDESFQFLQWTLISSKKGLSYASILGMSPTTGVLGMISLITSPLAKGTSIFWALLRFVWDLEWHVVYLSNDAVHTIEAFWYFCYGYLHWSSFVSDLVPELLDLFPDL